MKLKNYCSIIFLFSLVCILSLSMVSAEENSSIEGVSFDYAIGVDEIDDETNLDSNDENVLSNKATIYISPNGTGTGSSESDPTNWNAAYLKVSSGDTIQFSNGNFTNIKGNLDIDLELKGSGNTIIDAEKNGGFFTIGGTYSKPTVALTNLKFVNAYTGEKEGSPDGPKTGFDGEGAIVNGATLIINNCYFATNQGIGTTGGAIHNAGTCTVYNSTFFNNGGKKGGAFYCEGNAKLYIYDSTVNKCISKEGSAVHAKEGSYVEIHNCQIVNASAKNGLFYIKESTVKFFDSYFYNCRAVDTAAIIDVDKKSYVEVDNCTFDKLTATGGTVWFSDGKKFGAGNGGAILVEKDASITIKNSIFTNCKAKADGGAIYVESSGRVIIDNCTFKSNSAGGLGNHIYSMGYATTVSNSILEIVSTIETSDITNGQVENIRVTYDVGTTNILNPNVNVVVDNQNYAVSNGAISVSGLSEGDYDARLIANDSSSNSYVFSQESSYFSVGKVNSSNSTADENNTNPADDLNNTGNSSATRIDTKISVVSKFSRVACDYSAGERGGYLYATLKDAKGNVLANRTIQFALYNKVYSRVTNSDGVASFKVSLAKKGIYYFALSFRGDDNYEGSPLVTSKLTVTLKKTSIKASNKVFKAKKKTKIVKVTLKTVKNKYNGKTYLKAGKKLTLKVKGKTYTAKINKKGVAKFKIKLTKKGKYTAKITFKGDKTYKASKKSIKITIK